MPRAAFRHTRNSNTVLAPPVATSPPAITGGSPQARILQTPACRRSSSRISPASPAPSYSRPASTPCATKAYALPSASKPTVCQSPTSTIPNTSTAFSLTPPASPPPRPPCGRWPSFCLPATHPLGDLWLPRRCFLLRHRRHHRLGPAAHRLHVCARQCRLRMQQHILLLRHLPAPYIGARSR